MSERTSGWLFVGAQAALLGLVVFLPRQNDFGLPDWSRTALDVMFWVGVALAVIAGLSLGRSLTATPMPTATGQLRTGGFYRFVRHPIYTGVILIVVSVAVRSESFLTLGIGVLTLAFFNAKATWEEARLADHYPDYGEYAARTPRFIPNPMTLAGRNGSTRAG